jgi:hypothetical protein
LSIANGSLFVAHCRSGVIHGQVEAMTADSTVSIVVPEATTLALSPTARLSGPVRCLARSLTRLCRGAELWNVDRLTCLHLLLARRAW